MSNDTDATYENDGQRITLYPQSTKGAQWIGRHSTTNVSDRIFYSLDRGRQIIAQMEEDGLKVVRHQESL